MNVGSKMPALQDAFARYVVIGGLCFVIDFSILRAFLKMNPSSWAIGTIVAFVLANSVHFTLNKWWNFRNHDREIHEQFGTYIGVLGLCLLITIGTIAGLGHWFGVATLVAKVVAVIINIPVGFLGHRYLTFNEGLAPVIARLRGTKAVAD